MADVIHRLRGPDGKVHRIRAPEGTPPEELEAELVASLEQPEAEEPGLGTQIAKGAMGAAAVGAAAFGGAKLQKILRRAFPSLSKNRAAAERLVEEHAKDGIDFRRSWNDYIAETQNIDEPISYADWFAARDGAASLSTTKFLRDTAGLAREKDPLNQALYHRKSDDPVAQEMMDAGKRAYRGKAAQPPDPHWIENLGVAGFQTATGHPFAAMGTMARAGKAFDPALNAKVHSVITDYTHMPPWAHGSKNPNFDPMRDLLERQLFNKHYSDLIGPAVGGGLAAYSIYGDE